jgi:hypothetical protein
VLTSRSIHRRCASCDLESRARALTDAVSLNIAEVSAAVRWLRLLGPGTYSPLLLSRARRMGLLDATPGSRDSRRGACFQRPCAATGFCAARDIPWMRVTHCNYESGLIDVCVVAVVLLQWFFSIKVLRSIAPVLPNSVSTCSYLDRAREYHWTIGVAALDFIRNGSRAP